MSRENKTWRLIDSGPGHPYYNMAVDEAMLKLAGDSATMRFYSWNPPALSLGYFQGISEFDLDELKTRQIPIVRRPTGGGAIYHYRELTFAVVAGRTREKELGSTIEERYEKIHGVVIKALGEFQIDSNMRGGGLESPFCASKHRLCFNRTIGCDIVSHGRKLVGSAQRKTPYGFLQHGSIPLHKNLMTPDAAWVNMFSDREITYELMAQSLAKEFAGEMGVELEIGELTPQEESLANELVESRYLTDSWNMKK